MDEYYEEKPCKIHAKRKKENYGEILEVINKSMKKLNEKKQRKHKQWQLNQKEQKQQLNIPAKENKQKVAENDSKLLLSGKFDFDP